MSDRTFGATIRAARAARGWSQTKLVFALHEAGFDTTTTRLSVWENDRVKPEARALAALVGVLQLDPAAVLATVGRWPGWSSDSRRR